MAFGRVNCKKAEQPSAQLTKIGVYVERIRRNTKCDSVVEVFMNISDNFSACKMSQTTSLRV